MGKCVTDEGGGIRHRMHILGCGGKQVNEEKDDAGEVLIHALTGELNSFPECRSQMPANPAKRPSSMSLVSEIRAAIQAAEKVEN